MACEVARAERLLMGEEQVVQLPVTPLLVRALGGTGRAGGIRMDVEPCPRVAPALAARTPAAQSATMIPPRAFNARRV
jgi:hypothetical protein